MAGTFHVINLGCKVNRAEAETMTAQMLACGAERSGITQAKVILINTCTVTAEADAKSRKAMHRALREAPPDAVTIVCGCGAAVNPEQFKGAEYDGADGACLVIANKHAALKKAGELLGSEILAIKGGVSRVGEGFNTRTQIKIQDGCDNSCSYCIVPRARGSARSESFEQILEEIGQQTRAGTQEIVLTGIDIGSYRDREYGLEQLLRRALELDSTCRFRLSSIELPGISDELIQLISSACGRICAHLHIPLQSGSDALLTAMNRRYNAKHFLQRVGAIKCLLPHMAFSTDVIVGFPGETEEDFCDSLDLCAKIGFSRIHIFRYSKRPGTPAEKMTDLLPADLIAKRAARLRSLADELTQADALSRLGSREQVLIESTYKGRSESYYPVRVNRSKIDLSRSTLRGNKAEYSGYLKRGSLVVMELVGYERGELIAEEC